MGKKEKRYPWTIKLKKPKNKKHYSIDEDTREYLLEEIFQISYHISDEVSKYLCYIDNVRYSEDEEHQWELRDDPSNKHVERYEEITIQPDLSKYEIRELIQDTLDIIND